MKKYWRNSPTSAASAGDILFDLIYGLCENWAGADFRVIHKFDDRSDMYSALDNSFEKDVEGVVTNALRDYDVSPGEISIISRAVLDKLALNPNSAYKKPDIYDDIIDRELNY